MQVLIGIAILAALALLVSSRRLWAWRRSRVGAMLTTGGWLAVLVGLLLGARGIGIVQTGQIEVVQPLVAFFLGWVGLLIGLQLRLDLPKVLPPRVFGVLLVDGLVSLVGFVALSLLLLDWLAPQSDPMGRIVIAVLIGCAAVGWSSEVRSLRSRRANENATRLLRATAGLSSVLAIVLYGVLFMLIEHVPVTDLPEQSVVASAVQMVDPTGPEATGDQPLSEELIDEELEVMNQLDLSAAPLAMGAALSVALALVVGVLALWLTRLAGKNESQFLVVLLALVALLSGAATTLGYSPLFVALLGGLIIANLPGRELVRFQQVVAEAEQPIAMAVMLVAGVVADPLLPLPVLGLIVALILARVVVKLPIGRWTTGSSFGDLQSFGGLRQSPIAIALATGYAVSGHAELTRPVMSGEHLVMAVIIIGLVSDLLPLAAHVGLRGDRGDQAEMEEGELETTDGQMIRRRPANPIKGGDSGGHSGGEVRS